ncbi:hypothetical protein ACIRU3_45535 [Streptomyces sp. NPDC101151]|uniref:hypothetical protein n=1 Tax=Streptomyces sp. NPDC101151 TaxID=3366115 RepID=UPI00380CE8E4
MAHVRRRRLEGARRELDQPGSSSTVAAVAARRQIAGTSLVRRAHRNAHDTHPDRSTRISQVFPIL